MYNNSTGIGYVYGNTDPHQKNNIIFKYKCGYLSFNKNNSISINGIISENLTYDINIYIQNLPQIYDLNCNCYLYNDISLIMTNQLGDYHNIKIKRRLKYIKIKNHNQFIVLHCKIKSDESIYNPLLILNGTIFCELHNIKMCDKIISHISINLS